MLYKQQTWNSMHVVNALKEIYAHGPLNFLLAYKNFLYKRNAFQGWTKRKAKIWRAWWWFSCEHNEDYLPVKFSYHLILKRHISPHAQSFATISAKNKQQKPRIKQWKFFTQCEITLSYDLRTMVEFVWKEPIL